jgi:cyclophilin family peptidyl-prolyl cis-trans isomerase
MIQGGDPSGDGTGGESIWGGKFDGGKYFNLIHAAGAIAYANSGSTSTDGSQFYIVTGKVYSDDEFAELKSRASFTDSAEKVYKTAGGTPFLDGRYTVFGQVYDGLDIIFKAQNTETDESDKPKEDLIIESVTVEKYDGESPRWYISDYEGSADTTKAETEAETEADTTAESTEEETSTEASTETTTAE